MITYHQAFDIYHTTYRVLKLLEATNYQAIEKDRLRIFDFIILFPHDLEHVKLPIGSSAIRSKFKETKFNALPDRKRIFIQVGKYFDTSMHCLLSYEMINPDKYKENKIVLTKVDLAKSITSFQNQSFSNEIVEFLKNYFLKMTLTELKERTGLIEYRYDLPQA